MWYGLTREEAERCCKSQGLEYRFIVTMDPGFGGGGSPELRVADNAVAEADTVPKVIRAKKEDGVMCFLLGYFVKEKRNLVCRG